MNIFELKNSNSTKQQLNKGALCLVTMVLATSPMAEAVTPAPDGGYPGGNTAEGQKALLSLTTGGFNTAVGFFAHEQREVQEQKALISQLRSTVAKQETTAAEQQRQIEALTAGLHKVSAQLELSKGARQLAADVQ